MKTVQLSGSVRQNVGKKDAVSLRNSGKVPAVLYGAGTQTHFAVDALPMSKLVITPNVYQIELDIEGTKNNAIIKEVQFHPVTEEIIHVDFLQLSEDKPVKLKLPLRLTGNSLGVRNGGKLLVNFRKVDVVGLPSAFPDDITVDITDLRIGMSVRVRDLSFDGLTFLNDPAAMVVQVKMARGAVDAEEGEEEGEEAAEGAEAPAAE
jgi:large subunit ribosomal protein L25